MEIVLVVDGRFLLGSLFVIAIAVDQDVGQGINNKVASFATREQPLCECFLHALGYLILVIAQVHLRHGSSS